MSNACKILVAVAIIVLLVSCALSPGQQQAIGAILADARMRGDLTEQQYAALLEALASGNYSHLWQTAVDVGAAVILSLLGVRVWRGSTMNRRGAAPGSDPVPGFAPPGIVP